MTEEQIKYLEVKKNRENSVIKDNNLINHTRYELSVTEQKVLIYAISKIMAEDTNFKTIKFSISEYCDIAGIKKGGNQYNHIKDSIKSLSDKSWWIDTNRKSSLFRWIDTADIEENNGTIEIKLSESLKPFLLDIKGNFTKYELINILVLHSKYSIRLYEIFKSHLWLSKWEIEIEEFKNIIGIKDKYKDYTELKRNILLPSIKEINKYTDLNISYEPIKFGNKTYKLIFDITEKQGVQMVLDLIFNQEDRLKIED